MTSTSTPMAKLAARALLSSLSSWPWALPSSLAAAVLPLVPRIASRWRWVSSSARPSSLPSLPSLPSSPSSPSLPSLPASWAHFDLDWRWRKQPQRLMPMPGISLSPAAQAAHALHFQRVHVASSSFHTLASSAARQPLLYRDRQSQPQTPWGTPSPTPPPPQPPPSPFANAPRAYYSSVPPQPPTPPPPSLRSLLAHFNLRIRHFFRRPLAAPPAGSKPSTSSPSSSSSSSSSPSSSSSDSYSHSHSSSSSSSRPWTADERLALLSWLFVGNSLFILVGTTTFVSLALWLANSFAFDDVVAYALGWYVTRATGATVIFDGGLEPDWKEGRIHLRQVRVRRMHALDESTLEPHYYYEKGPFEEPLLLKGLASDDNNEDDEEDDNDQERAAVHPPKQLSRDDNNFTKYDLSIASISITLDLVHWLDGKGLVKTATVRGVRGIIDRRDVFWDDTQPSVPTRRVHQPGDFEIQDLQVDDLFITVYNPEFRPYSVSVFHAELPQLRKQWLLYDVICASSLVGLFDNCLFSVHAPQLPATAAAAAPGLLLSSSSSSSSSQLPFAGPAASGAATFDAEEDDAVAPTSSFIRPRRISRLKIDNVPIDHLNYGTSGPFGWINGGTLDISATIHIPRQRRPQDMDKLLAQLMHELKASARDRITFDDLARLPDKVQQVIREVPVALLPDAFRSSSSSAAATAAKGKQAGASTAASTPAAPVVMGPPNPPPTLAELAATATQPYLLMDLQLKFNNIRASVPLLPDPATAPSYLTTTALIRPVVAYMNAHRTAIPLSCRLAMPLSDFDGAWTIYNAGLTDALATGVGKAMVDTFLDDAERARRIRKVGLWSVRTVAEGVAGMMSGGKGLVQFLEGVMRSQMRMAIQNEGRLRGEWDEWGLEVPLPPVERRR